MLLQILGTVFVLAAIPFLFSSSIKSSSSSSSCCSSSKTIQDGSGGRGLKRFLPKMNFPSLFGSPISPEPITLFPCGGDAMARKELEQNDEIIRRSSSSATTGTGACARSPKCSADGDDLREGPTAVKTVYLIRHAESDENRRLASLGRSLTRLGKFSLPAQEDIAASVELLDVKSQVDTDVSEVGRRQIINMAGKLSRDSFLIKRNIQVVAHSPLKRARQTSEGLLGCVTAQLPPPGTTTTATSTPMDETVCTDVDKTGAQVQLTSSSTSSSTQHPPTETTTNTECDNHNPLYLPPKKAPPVQRVVELTSLSERTPIEWVNQGAFARRILEFEKWLDEQPEERIAIVGHSQYFKTMLNLPYKFRNCDVWELQYTPKLSRVYYDEEEEEEGMDVGVDGNAGEPTQQQQQQRKREQKMMEEEEFIAHSSSSQSMEMPSTGEDADVTLRKGWSGLKNLFRCDDDLQ